MFTIDQAGPPPTIEVSVDPRGTVDARLWDCYVPYGTEAVWYQEYAQTLVLGPGNIAQAHAVDEWVSLGQLQRAFDIYLKLVENHD